MNSIDYKVSLKEDDSWYMHKLHFHESIEIMLVLSNDGQFFLDKEMYPLQKNTLIVLPSNTLHRDEHGIQDTRFRRYVFHVLPSLLEQVSTKQSNFAAIIRKSAPCIQLTDEVAGELMQLFEQARSFTYTGFGADIRERMVLYQILLVVCSEIQHSRVETGASNPDYNRVEPILEYIREVYREPLKLDDLALHFLMNKHYLCHLFKKGTGFSVMEYVIQLRIIEAQGLLRQGHSVQESGEMAGFQSYEYFIRSFNKYMGISPKQYAKQYLNGERASVGLISPN